MGGRQAGQLWQAAEMGFCTGFVQEAHSRDAETGPLLYLNVVDTTCTDDVTTRWWVCITSPCASAHVPRISESAPSRTYCHRHSGSVPSQSEPAMQRKLAQSDKKSMQVLICVLLQVACTSDLAVVQLLRQGLACSLVILP